MAASAVTGTHQRWDTQLEYEVRKEINSRCAYDHLSNTEIIALERGDLLVFSANMIHRGLYGKDRFSFDIIFCDSKPTLFSYADLDCFPSQAEIETFYNPSVFNNALSMINK